MVFWISSGWVPHVGFFFNGVKLRVIRLQSFLCFWFRVALQIRISCSSYTKSFGRSLETNRWFTLIWVDLETTPYLPTQLTQNYSASIDIGESLNATFSIFFLLKFQCEWYVQIFNSAHQHPKILGHLGPMNANSPYQVYTTIYIYLEPKWPLFCLEKTLFWRGLNIEDKHFPDKYNKLYQGSYFPKWQAGWFQPFFMFTRIPGEMIQFDLRIFFKGVGEKPPTRQQWVLPFRPVMSWEVWWCHWGFGEKKRLWVGGSVVQDVRGLVQPFPTKFGPWRINWKPFPKIDGLEGSTRYLYSFPYVFLGAPEKQGLRCLREILVNKYPSLPNSSWGERCLDSWYQLEKGGGPWILIPLPWWN